MPRFLLLNYLDEVKKQHEFLLNKWQLTSPKHLDSVDCYAHNGALEDYVYRLPWLRVPDKSSIQHHANIEDLNSDLRRLADVVNDLEKYSHSSKGVVQIVHENGDVIEVVPSSNPDSPPLDRQQVVEINHREITLATAGKTEQDVCCQPVDLTALEGVNDDDEYLPELMESNIFQESLSKLPRLQTLCERLKTKPVVDPLATNEMDVIRKELIYTDKKPVTTEDDKSQQRELQVVMKMDLPSSPDQDIRLLEEPCDNDTSSKAHTSETYTRQLSIQKMDPYEDVLQDPLKKVDCILSATEDTGIEPYDAHISPSKGLYELNTEGIRERKKVTDRLLFESVVKETETSMPHQEATSVLESLNLEKDNVKLHSTEKVLSPEREKQVKNMIWRREKRFLDYPSLRLPEPKSVPSVIASKLPHQIPHQITAFQHLNLQDKSHKVMLDSKLSWNPVVTTTESMHRMSDKMEDYDQAEEVNKDDEKNVLEEMKTKVDLYQFDTWGTGQDDTISTEATTNEPTTETPAKVSFDNSNQNQQIGPSSPDQGSEPRLSNPDQGSVSLPSNPDPRSGPQSSNPDQRSEPRPLNPNYESRLGSSNPNQESGLETSNLDQESVPKPSNRDHGVGPRPSNPDHRFGPQASNPDQGSGPELSNPDHRSKFMPLNQEHESGPRSSNSDQGSSFAHASHQPKRTGKCAIECAKSVNDSMNQSNAERAIPELAARLDDVSTATGPCAENKLDPVTKLNLDINPCHGIRSNPVTKSDVITRVDLAVRPDLVGRSDPTNIASLDPDAMANLTDDTRSITRANCTNVTRPDLSIKVPVISQKLASRPNLDTKSDVATRQNPDTTPSIVTKHDLSTRPGARKLDQSSSRLDSTVRPDLTTRDTAPITKSESCSIKKERTKAQVFNPLDDFLRLRTVPMKREAVKTSPKKPSKITKKETVPIEDAMKPLSQQVDVKKLQDNKGAIDPKEMGAPKKSKTKLVEVMLTEPFLDILGVIEMTTRPVLAHLRKMGIISASYSFTTLTPDITRFLLKQQEKVQDSINKTDTTDVSSMRLKCLLQLHALITTAELVMHCELTTAILHLSAVQEKYNDSLEGSMTNVRQALYQRQCKLHQHKVMHPKLMAIIQQVSDWYKRKLSKDGGDHDPKILIIIRREARKLVEVVAETLSKVQGINTSTSQSTPMKYDTVSHQLDTCNCLVLMATQIGQDFPWALFSLVLEYEYIEASPWLALCERQKIRHIALKTMPSHAVVESGNGEVDAVMSKDCIEEPNHSSQSVGNTLKLIASEEVIHCSQLLQLLESKHDIMLLERNYSKMTMADPSISDKLYFADLIVDERSGIILQDLHKLSEPNTTEPLVNRMTKLSLQYTICWLILYRQKGKHMGYPLGGQAVNNLARLQAALAQFSAKTDGYEAKVVFADDLPEVAQLIRRITDNAAKCSANWHKTDWLQRPWLANDISKHEKVLVQYPCLNSFSAQVMLTAAPLRQLLMMSLPELIATCPWIQRKNLQMFHSLTHGLQENLPTVQQQKSSTKSKPKANAPSTHQPTDSHRPSKISSVPLTDPSSSSSSQDQGPGVDVLPQGYDVNYTQSRRQSNGDRGVGRDDGCNPESGQQRSRIPLVIKQEYNEGDDTMHQRSSQEMTPLEFISRPIKQEPGLAHQSSTNTTNSSGHLTSQSQHLQNIPIRPPTGQYTNQDRQQYGHQALPSSYQQGQNRLYDDRSYMEAAPRYNESYHNYPDEARQYRDDRYYPPGPQHHGYHAEYPDQYPNLQQRQLHGSSATLGQPVNKEALPQHRLSVAKNPPHHHHPHLPQQPHPPHLQSSTDSLAGPERGMRNQMPRSNPNERYGNEEYRRQVPVMYHKNQEIDEQPLPRYEDERFWTGDDPMTRTYPGRYSSHQSSYTHHDNGTVHRDQSVPSNAEIYRAGEFAGSYEEGNPVFCASSETDNQQVPLTPSKKRRLTYERVPGTKGGQTRLTFF